MTTFKVTTAADVVNAGDGKLSLREAVAQANATAAADRIVFVGGLEGKTLALAHGELLVTHDLTIDGDANNDGVRVTIDGHQEDGTPNGRLFHIMASSTDVALRDLALTGGYVDVDQGTVHVGGAIFLGGGSLAVAGCTISGNRSGYADGGGIFADDGSRLTITSSKINNNSAHYYAGGGIAGGSDVTVIIRDSEISGNRGNYGGIGVDLSVGSSLTMEDSRVSNNFSDEGGGRGVFVHGVANIATSTISGNYGGGIFADQLILTDSTVAGNNAGGYDGGSGGGIRAGDVVIRNSTITDNRSAGDPGFIAHGGGVLAEHIDISNSIVAGNTLGDYTSGSPDAFDTIVASDGHNVFGSAVAGSIPGDVDNVPAAKLFAALDPFTGGGLVGPSGIVQLLNDVANPAVSAADILAASATGQTGASRPLPASSLPDVGSVEIGQPLSTPPSANNDVITDGGAGHTVRGLAGADYIKGMGGADTLYGGAGSDLLDGGPGNDQLYGDTGIDLVFYGGSTKVTVDLSLATDKAFRGSETDTLHEVEGAIGSSAGDTFKGDGGVNWFHGGLGKDTATGGGGRDLYDFDSVADSKPGSARDVVKDFAHLTDKLDLMGIDADGTVAGNQAFRWVGSNALAGPGEAGFFTSGGNTIVQASTDADAAAEFQLQLTGIKALTATDFYL